ncbi:flagellar biosynthesis protein FlhB [Paenibacillus typhae]|uniref:flagellar biosynthesis protein FlhB n=1 Tax=Paenibacillus typhae TaxID=1174501 RepID=UPI001C8DC1DA|nr:flagellar biosynthesis protein FlhB [Paenibacillus typhae]MBY0010085.1 flagellar biosynthesis protein FlhB [Paenibacillus typhae]
MHEVRKYKLDLQLFGGDKTEKPTGKRRSDARKKGQVPKSAELSGAIVLLSALISMISFGSYMKERLITLYTDVLKNRMLMEVTSDNVIKMFNEYGIQILILLAPLLIIILVAALVVNYAEVGFLYTTTGITPKFSKLNPISGFKNIFSMRSFVEFLKSVFKLLIVAYLVYSALWGERDSIASLTHVDAEGAYRYAAKMTMNLGLKIGSVLLVLAIFDYMYQRFQHEKSLKMSKQEIKDEYKNQEGDPQIKGKIKAAQRKMAMMRMMQEVPNADVIITNPTHFAVALKYDGTTMEAPQIVAKGQDYVALRIRELAKEHGVTTMENKPLARALFQRAEIGDVVPQDLFQAVAEVLAYVYKLKGKRK